MQKYHYNDGVNRYGPFTLEELQAKNITAATPIWYDGLPEWTPAGQLEELKSILTAAIPEASPPAAETISGAMETTSAAIDKGADVVTATADAVQQQEPVLETVTAAGTPAKARPPAGVAGRKGSPAVSWVLSLLVLGGTGYYVYQDMEKNKKPGGGEMVTTISTDNNGPVTNSDIPAVNPEANGNDPVTTVTVEKANVDTSRSGAVTTPGNITEPVEEKGKPAAPPTLGPPAKDPAAAKKQEEKQKQLIAEAKKKADEQKKKLADAKKEEEKKKLAAKETEMRNNWSRYVTLGALNIEGDDKVKPFAIPVYNGYAVPLDKVTLRVDYIKKDKVVSSETLVLNNIPGKGNQSVQATGNKKGKTANVYITGITSRQLHFCYPVNNGNPADPYLCN